MPTGLAGSAGFESANGPHGPRTASLATGDGFTISPEHTDMTTTRTMSSRRFVRRLALATAFLAAPLGAAGAQATADADGDWLPSYTGPRNSLLNGDMDILNVQFLFDGTNFTFKSTSAGNIGSTTGGFFIWGVNRGAGTARFPTLAPGVLFDWVLSITPGGAITTRDLVSGTATTLAGSSVTFSGATMTAIIPATLLPSQGFSLADFTANLWPRVGGALTDIADFAPDNSNIRVTVTPEPMAFGLLATGLFALLVVRRRRSR
jgi:hypothetical protein